METAPCRLCGKNPRFWIVGKTGRDAWCEHCSVDYDRRTRDRAHATPEGLTVHGFIMALRQGSRTSLGSYPLFFLTSDGGTLHPKCAREEVYQIARAIRDNDSGGWRVVAHDVNYEDPEMFCDHCNRRIESAYAEDCAERKCGPCQSCIDNDRV